MKYHCFIVLSAQAIAVTVAFAPLSPAFISSSKHVVLNRSTAAGTSGNSALNSFTEEKAATAVTGEQLEVMLTEWDEPLVVDAYATWCGPCLLMAPEFEKAAQDLKGRVRFAKLDTDQEPEMAGRLNVMGLPTLLFLDKFESKDEEDQTTTTTKAVLKDRIEGAIRKDSIVALCEHHFFGGPRPKQL